MESSIEKQKASVRKQLPQAAQVTESQVKSWFTQPWSPLPLEPLGPIDIAPVSAVPADCDPMPLDQVKPLIQAVSQKEGVPGELIQRVIEKESAFRPCAVSPKGAQGLMQLMPAVAQEYGVRDPLDPEQNIRGGALLLKKLLGKYNQNLELVLSAYNAGSGRVDREGGIPNIAETKDYVSAILKSLMVF